MPDKAYPRRAHRGFDFPSQDFFGKFCHVAKVATWGQRCARTADGKGSISANTPDAYPTVPRQYSRLQFHCNRSIAQLFHCLASPPRAFTRHQPGTKFHWSTGRNLRPVAANIFTINIRVLLKQFIRKFDVVRLKLWSSVNLMRFCQSSAT